LIVDQSTDSFYTEGNAYSVIAERAYTFEVTDTNREVEIHASTPNLTPVLVNSIKSNPVNNEVLTAIDFGAASERGFGSTGRLQEAEINT
jgi:hypothetical protein